MALLSFSVSQYLKEVVVDFVVWKHRWRWKPVDKEDDEEVDEQGLKAQEETQLSQRRL
jgi:hypothetical protein